ncbi:MAG: hypothetical protein LPL29_02205 [Alphaproteobacteria bacterium]|nr:hypothetical protein [Alphaproteobacteria bacterium]
MTTGSVRLNQVEMMESGSRTLRAGATIKIPNSLGLDITPGATIVQAGGKSYTVIGVSGIADHRGIRHYLQLECVVKTDGDPQ